MAARCSCLLALIATASLAQSPLPAQFPRTFAGRELRVETPPQDPDGFDVHGKAILCLGDSSARQCHESPKDYGRYVEVGIRPLGSAGRAILFTAASGGVSGYSIYLSLLRLDSAGKLENVLPENVVITIQGKYALLNVSRVSPVPLFVTADYVWGRDESHFSPHRFLISTYVWRYSHDALRHAFFLEDRYLTANYYDFEKSPDIIAAERKELLRRLQRVALLPQQ